MIYVKQLRVYNKNFIMINSNFLNFDLSFRLQFTFFSVLSREFNPAPIDLFPEPSDLKTVIKRIRYSFIKTPLKS